MVNGAAKAYVDYFDYKSILPNAIIHKTFDFNT